MRVRHVECCRRSVCALSMFTHATASWALASWTCRVSRLRQSRKHSPPGSGQGWCCRRRGRDRSSRPGGGGRGQMRRLWTPRSHRFSPTCHFAHAPLPSRRTLPLGVMAVCITQLKHPLSQAAFLSATEADSLSPLKALGSASPSLLSHFCPLLSRVTLVASPPNNFPQALLPTSLSSPAPRSGLG